MELGGLAREPLDVAPFACDTSFVRFPRLAAFLFLLLAAAPTSGCLGSKQPWSATMVASPEARITPQEVYRRKDRLFIRVTYTNLSSETVTITRDALSLQLSSGRVLPRSVGMTSRHGAYTLPPNGARAVFVDFRDDEIETAQSANLLWNGAVFAGAREIQVPPTPVSAR